MTKKACVNKTFFLPVALRPNAGYGLLIHEVSRSHTTTHHSRQDSPGRVISSSRRPPPDNTQHSQQTDIHAPGGIRTHNLSRRAAADLRLRLRGHWGRRVNTTGKSNSVAITAVWIQCHYIHGHQVTEHSVLFNQPLVNPFPILHAPALSIYVIPTYRTYQRPFVRLYSATWQSKDRFISLHNVTCLT